MVQTLLFANSVFMNTDFDKDGHPDDFNFYIKFIEVLTSIEYHNRFFRFSTIHAVRGREYLHMFMKYDKFHDVCLAVLFTAQPFNHNTLSYGFAPHSMSEDGGICKKNFENALAVTHYLDYADYVPASISEIVMVHELGHSLGAKHDSESCKGYVMGPRVKFTWSNKYFTFSDCSKEDMKEHLLEYGTCLEHLSARKICGNGRYL